VQKHGAKAGLAQRILFLIQSFFFRHLFFYIMPVGLFHTVLRPLFR